MRLSFVIPAYNEEAYLRDCIRSILVETRASYAETEIIVVNNASTDRTREVALEFPEVILVDEPVKGLTHARQAGFVVSRGELIANVDADSRLPYGWLDRVLAEFGEKEQMVALSGPVIYYDLNRHQRKLVHVFYGIAWLTYALNRYVLRVGSMIQGGNFVTTRAALKQINGFNLSISFYGEDTDLARRLNDVGKVRFTFALPMFSSARRLKGEGMLTTALRYTMNYFWTTFLERPFTLENADIRELPQG